MNANTNIRAGRGLCCLIALLWLAPAIPTLAQVADASDAAWEADYREWKEDPERVRRYWDSCLSAEDYGRAITRTGQGFHAGPRGAGGPWVPVGPTGNFIDKAYNGRISGVKIHDGGPTYDVFVGACGGGLWKASSFDGVGVWTSIGDTLPNPSVCAFARSPISALTFIVGTGDHDRYGGGGLFKTNNEGVTWTEIPLYDQWDAPVYPMSFFRISYRPGDASTVYAACESGIFVSTDSGDNWTQKVEGFATDLVVHPTNPDIQYACIYRPQHLTECGVYYTYNAWDTYGMFTDSTLPSGDEFDRASMAICRDYPDHLAIVVENDGVLMGVYTSMDAGTSWADVTTQELVDSTGSQIWHAQAIAFRPNNSNEIYVGAVGLARTTNGGSTWVKHNTAGIDIGHADITQLYFNNRTGDDVLWICNDGGIYRHQIGGATESWNGDVPTGLRTSQIHYMDAQRTFRVIGLQDNGTIYRPEGIPDWSYLASPDGFGVRITDVLSAEYWFVSAAYSPDPAHHIDRATGMPPSFEYTYNIDSGHYDTFFDRETEQMFSSGDNVLWSTPAFGPLQAWSVEPVAIPLFGKGDRDTFGSRLEPETLYISYWTNSTGNPPWLSACRRLGGVWYIDHAQLSNYRGQVQTVFASTEKPAECWAGLIGHPNCPRIVHTTDYWNTWEDLTNELADVGQVDAIAVTPFNPDQIFVGTDLGVFWSENGGQSWEPFQDSMPVVLITSLVYVPREAAGGYDKLVAATFGRGVYERFIEGPAITYVDQNHADTELGTFEYPYNTLNEGLSATTPTGLLGLRGDNYYVSTPLVLDEPMRLDAYDGAAVIR